MSNTTSTLTGKMLHNMMVAQQAVTIALAGPDIFGRPPTEVCWQAAILVELAEACDHLQYKWWKPKAGIDMRQAQLEVVDSLHFAISRYIAKMGVPAECSNTDYQVRHDNTPGQMILAIAQVPVNHHPLFVITSLVAVAGDMGMTAESLYGTYMVKNALNSVRAENGQLTGDYIKHWWGGKEDNVFAMQACEPLIGDAPDLNQLKAIIQAEYDRFLEDKAQGKA